MKYLIDTDTLIDFAHGESDAVRVIGAIVPEGVALSAVSLAEYLRGVYVSRQGERGRELLRQFLHLTNAPIFSVDEQVADKYGEVQAGLTRRGLKGNNFDVLIAATAMVHRLILVTGNAKDFKKIEGLKVFE